LASTAFVLLLGGPGLKFRRHFPQPPSNREIKGGSRQGNENFSLLTQVWTADHSIFFFGTADRVEGMAGSILLRLDQKYRLISIDWVSQARMRTIGVDKFVLGHGQSSAA
jgi:hypothetical protein